MDPRKIVFADPMDDLRIAGHHFLDMGVLLQPAPYLPRPVVPVSTRSAEPFATRSFVFGVGWIDAAL